MFFLILIHSRDANFLAKTQLYIGQKQWRSVKEVSNIPDHGLWIVLGLPYRWLHSLRIPTNYYSVKTGWRDFQARSDNNPCAHAHGSVEVLGWTAMEKCSSAFLRPSIWLLARAMVPIWLAICSIAQEEIDISSLNKGYQIILRADNYFSQAASGLYGEWIPSAAEDAWKSPNHALMPY